MEQNGKKMSTESSEKLAGRVMQMVSNSLCVVLTGVGAAAGLYDSLAREGHVTDAQLASSTGCVERYVAEGDLKVRPAKVEPDVMKAPWKWLRDSSTLVPNLLESDRTADRTTPMGTRGGAGKAPIG